MTAKKLFDEVRTPSDGKFVSFVQGIKSATNRVFGRSPRSLWPRAPIPLRWLDVIPLAGFLLLFAVLVITLEVAHTVAFARPAAFWLSLTFVWFWWQTVTGFSGLDPVRKFLALLVRLCVAAILIMTLAEPRAVRSRDVVSLIYALDVSDSIGTDTADAARQFMVETVGTKPQRDEAGLVVFARNAAVELPPRISFPIEAFNSRVERDATNLEQALSLSAAMIPEESRGRIVLVSDGAQTEGNFTRVLGDLKSRGIAVDVLPVQYAYNEEVWLERLELPANVKIGENYEATVLLNSLKAGTGKLTLKENGQIVAEETINFGTGKSRWTFPIVLREAGHFEYTALIEVPLEFDHLSENNLLVNSLFVQGEGKVLVVTEPQADPREYSDFVKALRQAKRLVEMRTASQFPRDPATLLQYDCVIFANVSSDAFDIAQLSILKDAVFNMGIGFLMIGGANSFGPGGYHHTVVEEMLPVSMEITQRKILPKGALVIVLHTCEFPEGNTWAKQITKQAIKVLSSQDEVGVILFDHGGGEKWLFPLTPARRFQELLEKINAAAPGDMPSFGRTMEMGLEGLVKSDAAAKHMIIISDGDPSPPPPALVQKFIDAKTSVSMVAIYPHGGRDISIMKSIATSSGGRYYAPNDPQQLPGIFIKEAVQLKQEMLQNREFLPVFDFPTPILKGIDQTPPLRGYVMTSLKPRAMLNLKAPPQEGEPEEMDPVLATWQFGLARTAAFTSDLSTNWGTRWVEWDRYQAFVEQLITSISRAKNQEHLRLSTEVTRAEATVIVDDFAPESAFLDLVARVSGPRNRNETIALKQIGPRRYQASLPVWGTGRYQVLAEGKDATRDERALGSFTVSYSPEYMRFRSNPAALQEIAHATGGRVLTKNITGPELFSHDRRAKQSSRPIFDTLLALLAMLIPFDVAVRRVQIDWQPLRRWLLKKSVPVESTATMQTLLERKQSISEKLPARRTSARSHSIPNEPPTMPPLQNEAPPVSPGVTPMTIVPPAETSPPPKTPDATTTERLLALKRKRQEEKTDDRS